MKLPVIQCAACGAVPPKNTRMKWQWLAAHTRKHEEKTISASEIKVQSDITISLSFRKTPRWAAKKWGVWRKQYHLGTIQWDVRNRDYALRADDVIAGFNSADLHVISEFLREETQKHRYELWERSRDRSSHEKTSKRRKGK